MKKAILLVTFGTSVAAARAAFERFDQQARERFPATEIRWAYTSVQVRRKLAVAGIRTEPPAQALAQLADEGFRMVAVQSLHVVPGEEFHHLVNTAHRFQDAAGGKDSFLRVAVGLPLFSSYGDIERVMAALRAEVQDRYRAGDALVLMGHGSRRHAADLLYSAAAHIARRCDSGMLVACVEGTPSFEDVRQDCRTLKIRRAFLMPLMSVAGEHAVNDLAGSRPDSWKSQLEADGIECLPLLRGMIENEAIAGIWLEHLGDAWSRITGNPSC